MKVLVTGSTGFIGSKLVKRLLQEGWQVRCLVRKKQTHIRKLEYIFGDLSDPTSLAKACKGVDIVFNLAAVLPHHNLPASEYFKTNYEGVKNILQASVKSKVKRVVHVSTVGIFGSTDNSIVDEKSKHRTNDPYSESKEAAEKLIAEYIKAKKIAIVIIRPTLAYGPGDIRPGFSDLFKFIWKRIFILVGSGENYFHTIYIDNLIDALLLAATKKEAIGEDFIIGDDPCPKMKEVVFAISKAERRLIYPFFIPVVIARVIGIFFDISSKLGIPKILNSRRVKFITENRRFSINKAKNILGFKPMVGLEEGTKITFNWYKENGYIN